MKILSRRAESRRVYLVRVSYKGLPDVAELDLTGFFREIKV